MFAVDDIDLSSSESDEKAPEAHNSSASEELDDWENAEDPDVAEQRRKEEAELKAREKEEEELAKKKRKEEKQRRKAERAEQAKRILEASSGDEGELFDVELIHENVERMDFQNALDAFGVEEIEDGGEVDISKLDIGRFKPNTVAEFRAYVTAIAAKVRSMDMVKGGGQKLVDLVSHMVDALTDAYKAAQIAELDKFMVELVNDKINEVRKGQGKKRVRQPAPATEKVTTGKTFMNNAPATAATATNDDFDDDFM